MLLPVLLLYFFLIISDVLFQSFSSSWFGAWVGLELNMMSFIPLITLKMNSYYSEAALKYFLIQALGSALFISSGFISLLFPIISYVFIFLALLLKLASAPFHFWFPQIMEGLNWPQIFLLSTIQKLTPMILLSYLLINNILIKMMIIFSILSAMTSALGGLNLLSLRKIIAFSSINHMSWMMIAISTGNIFWLLFYYLFTLFSITSMFYNLQMFTLSNLMQSDQNSIFHSILISFNLLSLGGLPPFTEFIPKWMLIQIMVNYNLYIPLFFLLFSALITLYFYLRIVIMFILMLNPIMNFNMKYKSLNSNISMLMKMFFWFIGLLLPIYFLLI
uniref:NADH-ubiquinone oxidoreductase chain 2 n=1 Tax=Metopaulias depressus TaxID=72635 RepID=A0A191TF76_9EUCA|nr:NADH dehydrogenase subunit 2 [Metopaulias depressus]